MDHSVHGMVIHATRRTLRIAGAEDEIYRITTILALKFDGIGTVDEVYVALLSAGD